jgi:regulator of sigma E protease
VLDGGHITMAIAEWIRGRPLPLRMLEALQTGCVLLLLTFVGFVTIKDVSGLREDADDATPITFRNPDSQ